MSRHGSTTGDIKLDLSQSQLAGVGAIALAWNEVEFAIDCCLYSGLRLSGGSWFDVVGRVQLDPKIDLLEIAATDMRLPPEAVERIKRTVGNVRALKVLRNNTVHCRVYNHAEGVGTIGKRGKSVEVSLSDKALESLYSRINTLRLELVEILGIFDLYRTGRSVMSDEDIWTSAEVKACILELDRLHAA